KDEQSIEMYNLRNEAVNPRIQKQEGKSNMEVDNDRIDVKSPNPKVRRK
ncbi:13287_t:CDS:2, partial [Gigaspora rosea]